MTFYERLFNNAIKITYVGNKDYRVTQRGKSYKNKKRNRRYWDKKTRSDYKRVILNKRYYRNRLKYLAKVFKDYRDIGI